MSSPTGPRKPVERPTSHTWRSIATELRREARVVEAHAVKATAARQLIEDQAAAESVRFGREVPADPVLLDVLASIDVVEGDVWLWRGLTNNHGVPTVRPSGRSERTVVRVLAEGFGIVTPDTNGILYPLNGREDVNPFHRRLRAGSNKRIGNPHQYRGAA